MLTKGRVSRSCMIQRRFKGEVNDTPAWADKNDTATIKKMINPSPWPTVHGPAVNQPPHESLVFDLGSRNLYEQGYVKHPDLGGKNWIVDPYEHELVAEPKEIFEEHYWKPAHLYDFDAERSRDPTKNYTPEHAEVDWKVANDLRYDFVPQEKGIFETWGGWPLVWSTAVIAMANEAIIMNGETFNIWGIPFLCMCLGNSLYHMGVVAANWRGRANTTQVYVEMIDECIKQYEFYLEKCSKRVNMGEVQEKFEEYRAAIKQKQSAYEAQVFEKEVVEMIEDQLRYFVNKEKGIRDDINSRYESEVRQTILDEYEKTDTTQLQKQAFDTFLSELTGQRGSVGGVDVKQLVENASVQAMQNFRDENLTARDFTEEEKAEWENFQKKFGDEQWNYVAGKLNPLGEAMKNLSVPAKFNPSDVGFGEGKTALPAAQKKKIANAVSKFQANLYQ